jgi:uncharacterized RDD family membrane protein YckC/type II secretory pathway pseudopilin PulG
MFCSKCGVSNADEASFCKGCGNPLGKQQATSHGEVVLPASLVQRFANHLIDGFAMYLFAFAVAIPAYFLFNETAGAFVVVIAFFSYHLIFEVLFQKTIGKMLTGTKVVNVTGERASFLALLGRTLARYIPFEPLSFLFYGSYPTKGWHDRLSRTLVVPKSLTPENVRAIDPEKIKTVKSDNTAATLLVILAGGLFFIAIIGILASVVLASLNSARDKGQDAAIKATLNNVSAQAELYYDDNLNSYEGLCYDRQTTLLLDQTFGDNDVEYVCSDSVSAYAITGPLNEEGYYCVDSAGTAKVVDYGLSTQTSCPQASNSFNSTGNTTSSNSVYQDLKEAEEYANSIYALPAMVDEETRLDRIYASYDNKMNYDYTLVNYTADELEWSALKDIILPGIKSSFCYDSSFEYYREEGIPMKWNYYGMYKSLIGSIELTGNDCI